MTDEERMELRRTIAAWAEHGRQLRTAYNTAIDKRDGLMYQAALNGIPIKTIAADAGVGRNNTYTFIRRWSDRHNTPYPDLQTRKKAHTP